MNWFAEHHSHIPACRSWRSLYLLDSCAARVPQTTHLVRLQGGNVALIDEEIVSSGKHHCGGFGSSGTSVVGFL